MCIKNKIWLVFSLNILLINIALADEAPTPLWTPSEVDVQMANGIQMGIEASIKKSFEEQSNPPATTTPPTDPSAPAPKAKAVRDAHAKDHGCVLADFVVAENIEELNLNYGVFKKPLKKYPAIIRFSNGSGDPRQDDKAGPRGMAIKLLEVEGTKMMGDEQFTQDFPMINHPVFFIKNTVDYVSFMKDRKAFMENPEHAEEAGVVMTMNNPAVNPPVNLVESTFFSMTPRQFGPTDQIRAVKYSAKPVICEGTDEIPQIALKDDPNALRLALTETLEQAPVCFEFRIQKFVNEEETPINNPVQKWNTPWITVATIEIPEQDFSKTKEQCENISISPWHSLPEHQPLGAIEFVRKQVYLAISKLRHSLNGVEPWEPKSVEDWLNKTF